MFLKVSTTLALIIGVVLIALWPWVQHLKPVGVEGYSRLSFQAMLMGYGGMVLFTFVLTASLAMLMIRNARDTYQVAVEANIKDLVDTLGKNGG